MCAKKRVVAYCRVSTDDESQETSFENQKSYFKNYVEKHDDLEFAELDTNDKGIYADKGVSGTKLSRPMFDKMLSDAGLYRERSKRTGKPLDVYTPEKAPKFDLILVKDVSRLARNMGIDSIVKSLADNHVYVVFIENESTTENSSGNTTLQIFYSIAEQESINKSTNVHIGYREGAKRGNIYVGGKIYGYKYIKMDKADPLNTNKLIIDEKQAAVVRKIYDLYTEEGLGHQQICDYLANNNIRNTSGNKFTRSTIRRILINKRYIGENEVCKYKRKKTLANINRDEEYEKEIKEQAKLATENLAKVGCVRIEPIISKEQFEKAQGILESRRKIYNNNCTYHGITPYARKIRCAKCGRYFVAQSRKYDKDNNMIRYYACTSRRAKDEGKNIYSCGNRSIKEDVLNSYLTSDMFYDYQIEDFTQLIDDCYKTKDLLRDALSFNFTDEINNLITSNNELQAELDRLNLIFRKGRCDEAYYDLESEKVKEALDKGKAKLEVLSNPLEKIQGYINYIDYLIEDMDTMRQALIKDKKGKRELNQSAEEALEQITEIRISPKSIYPIFKIEESYRNVYSELLKILNNISISNKQEL